MAEIYVQRKKRPLWPWVLVLLLVVGLILFFSSQQDGTKRTKHSEQAEEVTDGNSGTNAKPNQ